ncbi:RHS repeat-associated core domain-containing protein [Pseudomonas sp. NFIX10]|uniref:RHS repeat-associated core domain-containing protein n=1 Tax=unclassified Pseudomonas TaxID=196821 RepID=UPI0008E21CAE|nr:MULTISPECIES: RHS repeat-associated core domain-containing protein [unclassified Pseudomonas]SFB32976.1 RHS repeat-associated core domain-containing protein [Pseudomonas sp. NFIX10]SFE99339.1 RHS repeat-associated core domain-containing protein [Pseudomonas sp. NFACC06-1]
MSTTQHTLLCRYHYDPLDRLVGSTSLTKAHTQHFYLKERLTSEIQGSVCRSIFQQDDQLLAQQQRQSGVVEATLLATDQQRTVLHALDAIAYTPYGHRSPKGGLLILLGFNGERPALGTGHYLLGNGYRAFNPVLMRFNNPDSFSPFSKGGINAYAYCLGDPINRSDPTGHIGAWFGKILGYVDNTNSLIKTVTNAAPAKIASGHANTAVQPSFFEEIIQLIQQSLTRNTEKPVKTVAARELLASSVPKDARDPFIRRLKAVNENLASHGDNKLSKTDAQLYARFAHSVNTGQLSNSGAHAEAALMWGKKLIRNGGPDSVVGLVFNIGGVFGSGAHDASQLKTGAAIRK